MGLQVTAVRIKATNVKVKKGETVIERQLGPGLAQAVVLRLPLQTAGGPGALGNRNEGAGATAPATAVGKRHGPLICHWEVTGGRHCGNSGC